MSNFKGFVIVFAVFFGIFEILQNPEKSRMRISFNTSFFAAIFLYLMVMTVSIKAEEINKSPAGFIENKGQISDQNLKLNKDVLFMYCGNGLKIQLRKTGYSYELFRTDNLPQLNTGAGKSLTAAAFQQATISSHRIDIDFVNSNSNPGIIREQNNEVHYNYCINGSEIKNVRSFRKIIYENIYKNIDIEFLLSKEGALKYNIILNKGADINDVKFLCNGASGITKDESGALVFSTSLGDISENIPFSYYTSSPYVNNKVEFELSHNIISFKGNYNNSETLVIDPSTNRVWGTYFGGSSLEYCTSNGIDASNNIHIAGYSLSTANIATSGVYQSTLTGSFDAYLSKFNANGVQVWGTYFGGPSFDIFYAMHVMPNGIVYAAGDTGSTVSVASGGAHQTTYGGGVDDAILVKFDANGQRLWSTYNGGNLHDIASAVTVDGNGDVIISGHSESSSGISTAGTYGTVYSLNYDVFITKFNTNGVRQWGTYYGDTGADEAYAIAADAANNIYVSGFTSSVFGIATGSAFQSIIGGSNDVFLAKFDPAGANLIWGTYYGGSGDEKGTAVKIDLAAGNVYLGANTTSTNNIASPGAYQTLIGSADDAFIAAFSSGGARLWGTYYGGNDVDYINSLVLDADKNILVGGQTMSTNAMSSAGAFQPNLGGLNMYDAFFAKFGNNGVRKLGTYFGGADNDMANGISVDGNNKVYISGETTSTLSISTPGSHMQNYAGSTDAFLAKFCVAPEPTFTITGSNTVCVNNTYTLTASGGYPVYLWNTGSSSGTLAVAGNSVAGTYYYSVTVTDSDGCNGTSDSSSVIVNLCTQINDDELSAIPAIFPNPVNDKLNLSFGNLSGIKVIEIVSAIGEIVLKAETAESEMIIETTSLAVGIYFVKLEASNKSITKKIIIQ